MILSLSGLPINPTMQKRAWFVLVFKVIMQWVYNGNKADVSIKHTINKSGPDVKCIPSHLFL